MLSYLKNLFQPYKIGATLLVDTKHGQTKLDSIITSKADLRVLHTVKNALESNDLDCTLVEYENCTDTYAEWHYSINKDYIKIVHSQALVCPLQYVVQINTHVGKYLTDYLESEQLAFDQWLIDNDFQDVYYDNACQVYNHCIKLYIAMYN